MRIRNPSFFHQMHFSYSWKLSLIKVLYNNIYVQTGLGVSASIYRAPHSRTCILESTHSYTLSAMTSNLLSCGADRQVQGVAAMASKDQKSTFSS